MGGCTVRGRPRLLLPSVGTSLFWLPLPRPLLPLVFAEILAGDSLTGLGSFFDPLPRPRPLAVDALSEAPLLVADCLPPLVPRADCLPLLETDFSASTLSSASAKTVYDLTVLADYLPRFLGTGCEMGSCSEGSESSSSTTELSLLAESGSGCFSSYVRGNATGDEDDSLSPSGRLSCAVWKELSSFWLLRDLERLDCLDCLGWLSDSSLPLCSTPMAVLLSI